MSYSSNGGHGMDADKTAGKQRNVQVLEDLKLKADNGRKQSEFNGRRPSLKGFAKTVLAAIARDYQTHGAEIIQNTQGDGARKQPAKTGHFDQNRGQNERD